MWQIKLDGNCLLVCKSSKVMLRLYPTLRFDVSTENCSCRICIGGINAKGKIQNITIDAKDISSVFGEDVTALSCHEIFALLKDDGNSQGGSESGNTHPMGKYCKDDKEYIVTAVLNADGTVDYYSVQSTDGTESLQMDDISEYVYCDDLKPSKIWHGTEWGKSNTTGQKELFWVWLAIDGTPCYTAVGANPNEDASTIIQNINENYTMGLVTSMPAELQPKVTPQLPFEICNTGATDLVLTFQDLFDIAVADTGFTLPDGTAPDGILELNVLAKHKGQRCLGSNTTAEGFDVGAGTSLKSYGGGEGACYKAKYQDDDCDMLADQCIDLTTPITILAGAGLSFDVVGVLCDLDPTIANKAGGK